jgi:hypothetical protein
MFSTPLTAAGTTKDVTQRMRLLHAVSTAPVHVCVTRQQQSQHPAEALFEIFRLLPLPPPPPLLLLFACFLQAQATVCSSSLPTSRA